MTFIAHSSELAKDGDYVRLPNLTAYNNNGDIIVWNGRCPHRGAMLFDMGMGNKKMSCPYHGWNSDLIEGKVDRFPIVRVGEFLFADNDELDLSAIVELPMLASDISHRHSFDFMTMKCDWKVAVENALEDMHVAHVHQNTMAKLNLSEPLFTKLGRNSLALYAIDSRYAKRLGDASYFHMLVYPNTCISSVAGATYSIQQYFPNGPDTVFLTRLFASLKGRDGVFSGSSFFLESARQFNMRVFAEDAEICSRVEGTGAFLTANEKRVKWFREQRRGAR